MGLGAAIGVAAVGSSVLKSSSANKAANKAADATAQASAENTALSREIYGQNKDMLSPFVQTGTAAGALLNDFYGIPQTTQTVQPAGTAQSAFTGGFGGMFGGGVPGNQSVDWGAYVRGNPDAMANWNAIKNNSSGRRFGGDINAFGQFHYQDDGSRRDLTAYRMGQPAPTQQAAQPAVAPGTASRNAFAGYLANSDYAFQQATGNNQVNSGYAGAGTIQSGAAMKALEKYRQDLQSGYRNQWASGVANQQGVGLGAASALAGVGQNYVNTISANNNAAADARANAALRQQNIFGNALGTVAGIGLGGGFG